MPTCDARYDLPGECVGFPPSWSIYTSLALQDELQTSVSLEAVSSFSISNGCPRRVQSDKNPSGRNWIGLKPIIQENGWRSPEWQHIFLLKKKCSCLSFFWWNYVSSLFSILSKAWSTVHQQLKPTLLLLNCLYGAATQSSYLTQLIYDKWLWLVGLFRTGQQ